MAGRLGAGHTGVGGFRLLLAAPSIMQHRRRLLLLLHLGIFFAAPLLRIRMTHKKILSLAFFS